MTDRLVFQPGVCSMATSNRLLDSKGRYESQSCDKGKIKNPWITFGEEPEILFTRQHACYLSGIRAYRTTPISELQYSAEARDIPSRIFTCRTRLTFVKVIIHLFMMLFVWTWSRSQSVTGEMRGLLFHYSNGGQRFGRPVSKLGYHPTCDMQ